MLKDQGIIDVFQNFCPPTNANITLIYD